MRRIYLVDDDESLLRTLGRLLRIEGFEVVPFESPRSFLQALGQTTAGCVIADLKMPEMTGIEMYEAMERTGCSLPMIFLTGNARGSSRSHRRRIQDSGSHSAGQFGERGIPAQV